MGELYKRDLDADQEKTDRIRQELEKEELGKNLGITSPSGKELLRSVNQQVNGSAGNVDINFNLE